MLKVAVSSLPIGISYATFFLFFLIFFHYVFMTQVFCHVILGPKELTFSSSDT